MPGPARHDVLIQLARSSGGKFFDTPESLNDALLAIEVKNEEETTIRYVSLWQWTAVLACLLGMLSVEWVLRKMRNMP